MEKTSSGSPSQEESLKKKPRRTEIRAEREQRAHIGFIASFAPYLGDQHRRAVTTPHGDVVWVGAGQVETLKDSLAKGLSLGAARLFADFNRNMAVMAEAVGPGAIYQAKAELESAAAAMKEKVLGAAESGDFAPFLDAVMHYRFSLFRDPDLLSLVERIDRDALGGKAEASQQLSDVLIALSVGSGRYQRLSEEEKEHIVSACKEWRPICEKLNGACRRLWKLEEYKTSELFRKEALGRLAEEFHLDIGDVTKIETYLSAPSRRAKKSTPTEAMCCIVALKHFPQGDTPRHEKTIETIWLEHLDNYPEDRRRKRKTPTTSSADERTA
jgi:hypothetical protein